MQFICRSKIILLGVIIPCIWIKLILLTSYAFNESPHFPQFFQPLEYYFQPF